MKRKLFLATLLIVSALTALVQAGSAVVPAAVVPGVKASDPDPPDGARGVTLPMLDWEPGTSAKFHNVYLGTNPTPGPGELIATMWMLDMYWLGAPGSGLIPGTTYYWRVDEIEEDGTTIHTGDVWSFTAAPYTAYNPDPPDGAKNVPTDTDLSWTPGVTSITHDVYFGTEYADVADGTGGTFKGNYPDTTYDPGTLQMGMLYFWRIDEIAHDAAKYPGDVWSFKTVIADLVGLEIMGPEEVVEGSSAQYKAVAYYEDGSTKYVTISAIWWAKPAGCASIDENGLLTSAHIDTPTIVTIYAEYTEGDFTVHAKKPVWCVPFVSEGKIHYVDALNGDDDNDGLSPEAAFATIQKGIHSAVDGDAVLVYPGLYTEEVNFKGKAITVQSAEDAAVLEAPGNFAVSFYMGEGADSILRNFVICNSYMGIFITHSSPTITNVTVVNNEYGVEAYAAEPNISSSIFWDNISGDLFQCEPRYSCVERLGEGQDNINSDPCFVDPNNGDYHLLSRRGRYWPEYDVWVLDNVTSRCIDAGEPRADYSNEPEPNGGRINMGAYGGTAYASMSTVQLMDGDMNRDGIINMVDLAVLANNWLKSGPPPLNQPPYIIITAPLDGAQFWGWVATIELEADAYDADGTVVKVEFYSDGDKIGSDNDGSDGWDTSWPDCTPGTYTFTAKATDDRGATTTSPEIEITVRPPGRR